MTLAAQVLCALILLTGLYVIAVEALAAHQRGLARVHRGQAWQPRDHRQPVVIPEPQRDDDGLLPAPRDGLSVTA